MIAGLVGELPAVTYVSTDGSRCVGVFTHHRVSFQCAPLPLVIGRGAFFLILHQLSAHSSVAHDHVNGLCISPTFLSRSVAPMRGRGFSVHGSKQRGGGQDMFRSRAPNTSRPPSMHVDEFVKLENISGKCDGGQAAQIQPEAIQPIKPIIMPPLRRNKVGRRFLSSHAINLRPCFSLCVCSLVDGGAFFGVFESFLQCLR